jgi:hypothetical protein
MDRHPAHVENKCELASGQVRMHNTPGFLVTSRSWRPGSGEAWADVWPGLVVGEEGIRGDGY